MKKDIAKGFLLSAAYCASFLVAWQLSVDQWYLPAGLRAATLLFLPYRLWPYLLIGDAAALLMIRVPMVHEDGTNRVWAYTSPFLLMPCVALMAHAARRHMVRLLEKECLLLPLALALALWSTLCNMALSAALEGHSILDIKPIEMLVRYWLGDYMGMLMFIMPALLWLRRKEHEVANSRFLKDGILATGVVVALLIMAVITQDRPLHQLLMAMMVIPAIMLTLLHGWSGAAIGIVLANAAIGIMLTDARTYGAYNADAFLIQLTLTAIATGMFVFGSRLSSAFERARRFRHAREQALQLAQASYLQAERTLRRRVVEYSDITVHINKMRKDIVAYLRSKGQHAAAMEMTRTGMIQARLLDEYVTALYPLGIETHGLYDILRSMTFSNLCNTEFRLSLKGDSKRLSVGLQLATYRSVLNVIDSLPLASRHLIKARVWRTRHHQGIAVCVIAYASPQNPTKHVVHDTDWELAARLETHGGTCRRRHAYSISFLVSEAVNKKINLRL
ncbi:MASE1 domain-containing protein [Xanthomonas albilineans]|uniref:MASE1 domain-containing protein n=1 Tax=Xanthomonas albilineans TaxID=29447 RepID=UPI0009BBCD25|nr:MASE1 domain-containing protein [Xanthomonas albilineans]PPU93766.1 histidine kinase [Xanthomonas albilineans]